MRPIIVGAGPAGLTLAWVLREKKPIVLEKSGQIGGCHSVRRKNGLFSEHGPRVYSSTYVTTAKLLSQMGISFDKIFTPYKFEVGSIGGKTISSLKTWEVFQLAISYALSAVYPQYYKSFSMRDYCKDFSASTVEYFDRLCRLTDGAGIENYSVYKFLQIINQNFGYQFYQPRRPNDEGLFKEWGVALESAGVEIVLNAEVSNLLVENDSIVGVEAIVSGNNLSYKSDTVILAVPPKAIGNLCSDYFTPGSGRKLQDWIKDNSYIDYCNVTFQWNTKLNMESVWGFPSTEWGIASVVLSDYFGGNTLISVGITNVDSKVNGVTARTASDEELIGETFRQLREIYPELPKYDSAVIGSRIGEDSAYIQSSSDPSNLPYEGKIKGLYNAGTQNLKSQYSFTSMETAVVNAAGLANLIGGEYFAPETPWTLNGRILVALLLVIALVCLYVAFSGVNKIEKQTQMGVSTSKYK